MLHWAMIIEQAMQQALLEYEVDMTKRDDYVRQLVEAMSRAALIPTSIFSGFGGRRLNSDQFRSQFEMPFPPEEAYAKTEGYRTHWAETAEPLSLQTFIKAKDEIMGHVEHHNIRWETYVSPWLPSTSKVQIEIKRTFKKGQRKGRDKSTVKSYKVWVDQVADGIWLMDGRIIISPRMQAAMNRMAQEVGAKIDASVINSFHRNWWQR